MNRLSQQAADAAQAAAIGNLKDKTQGLSYDNNVAGLTGPSGGFLSGKKKALAWDAQGNLVVEGKMSLGGADLQTTLDGKQPKGDYVLNPEYTQYKRNMVEALKRFQPKGDYLVKPEFTQFQSKVDADMKGFQQKGDYALKGDLTAYAPATELAKFALKTELANLQTKGDYALKSELANLQAKGDYALKGDLNRFAPTTELGKFALKTDLANLQAKGDYALKGDLTGYAPVGELAKFQPKGDYALKGDLSKYALVSQIPANQDLSKYALVEDLKKYASADELKKYVPVDELKKFASLDELKKYAPVTELAKFASIDELKKYALADELKKFASLDELKKYALAGDLSKYALADELKKYATLDSVKDLSNLKASMDAISKVNLQELASKINAQDLSKYATKEDLKKYRELGFPMDFVLGAGDNARGDTGASRALVKDGGSVLAINYANDFKGGVRIDSQASVRGNLNVGDNVIMEGDNSWILHTPDDGRKTMFVAPRTADKKDWDWGKQTKFNADGSVEFSGPVTVGGKPVGVAGQVTNLFPKPDGFDKPAVQIGTNNDAKDTNIYSLAFGNAEGGTYTGMGRVPNDKKFFPDTKGPILGTHIKADNEFGIFSDGWNKLFAVQGGSGNVKVKGTLDAAGVTVGGKPLSAGGATIPDNLQTKTFVSTGNPDGWNWYRVNSKDGDLFFGSDNTNRGIWADGERPFTVYRKGAPVAGFNPDGIALADNKQINFGWDSDGANIGLKDYGGNRKDLAITWADDEDDRLRFIHRHHKDGEKELAFMDRNSVNFNHGVNFKGGVSAHNPNNWGTHFPWAGDNKNYIRGDTELRGNLNNIGDIDVGGKLRVGGKEITSGGGGAAFDGAMNDRQLRLRGAADGNHYVAYTNNNNVDGVRVQGHQGGQLGTNRGGDKTALTWNADGDINVARNARVQKLKLGDKWTLSGVGDAHGNDDWLRVFGGDEKGYNGGIAMNKLWVGTPDATIAGRNVLAEIDALKNRPAGAGGQSERVDVKAAGPLQFGQGFNREANAGQISYGMHDGGENGTLNIVGAGKNGQPRMVNVWESLRTTQAIGVGDMPRDWTGANFKRRDGRWTHFDWKDDQRNYIRGDTVIDGNVIINGQSTYQPIRPRNTLNKCLDVEGARGDNGAKVQLWDCHYGPNQHIAYNHATKQLVFQHSNKCVDVAGGADGNGTQIHQWDCGRDNINQKFVYDGAIQAYRWAGNPNRCIDLSGNGRGNGTKVQLWDCNSGDAQRFI